jgi:signal transduction protein with GAF and PtsI domain
MVVGRTQEITRSCGVAIGLLHRESVVVYPAGAGVAATMGEPHFQASLFQSCRKTSQALQLCDAQTHPRVGATCRREGIGSLIIVPILHNREVAGAIELLFKERGSFSTEDVMDLELIADVISEKLSVSVCKEELDALLRRSAA